MSDYTDTLRKLSIRDDAYVEALLTDDRTNLKASGFDRKTHALVQLGAMVAIDPAPPSYMRLIDVALECNASPDEIVARRPDLGVLVEQAEALRASLATLPAGEPGRNPGLTGAELRLLPFLTTHLSFREIGERLYLSRNTIKTQAISVYRKLGVSTRGDAIDEAVRLGLVAEVMPGKGFVHSV